MLEDRPGLAPRVLKQGASRSVLVDRTADGRACVVKRFHGRSSWAALWDRARAARELRMLALLSARRLPVPQPLGSSRTEDAYEVRMAYVPRAHSLSGLLDGRVPWPAPAERILVELGTLVARLHALHVEHPDLHPGNALVDENGRVWVLDFHSARARRSALDGDRIGRQLVHLAAGTRERLTLRQRQRFLMAWWRTFGAGSALARQGACPERSGRARPTELARWIEEGARIERVQTVAHRRARWTRAGSAVRVLDEGRLFERVDRAPGTAAALDAIAQGCRDGRHVMDVPALAHGRVLMWTGLSQRAARRAWHACARLEEHALPVARALCCRLGPSSWIAFDLPAGLQPLEDWSSVWKETGAGKPLVALADVAARLWDCGLALCDGQASQACGDGGARLVLAGSGDVVARPAQTLRQALLEWQLRLSAPERVWEHFEGAFARAARATPHGRCARGERA